MSTAKNALARKSGALIHVRSGDMVVEALRQMRDNRVRSVLVIDDDVLVGIVTQGDCAIKVLLPGLECEADAGGPSDDGQPGDGQAGRSAGRLHGNDGCARFSPSASAGRG
ncbi:MAG TPA: CBS domain-containing protein [Bradyrhizobium sp.]|nr:CBS domain-containing protein [Bradyrhizobium sp.]